MVVLLDANEWEHADGKRNGDEIATIVGNIVSQVAIVGNHIVALQRDELPLLLNGNAKDGTQGLSGAILRVYHLELRLSIDGAPQVAHVEILEEQGLDGQHEIALISVAASDGQIAIEKAIAVDGIIEFDDSRLEEIIVSQPRILVCGGWQHALLGWQRIVLRSNNGSIGPRTRNVFERVGGGCVQMVLQNQRQTVIHICARGNYLEIALLNGTLDVFGTSLIEWHAESLDSLVHLGEGCIKERLRPLNILVVVSGRVAHFLQYLRLECLRKQRKRRDEVVVHLATALLQLGIGGEEGVDVFHELGVAHVERPPKVEQVHILLHGDVVSTLLGIWSGHEERDRRCRTHHLIAIDKEIKAVHLVEVESLLVLLQEHLDGLAQQTMLG